MAAPFGLEYRSAVEAWAALERAPENDMARKHREEMTSSMRVGAAWYGGARSIADARRMATSGETPAFAAPALASVQATLSPALRPRRVRSVAGGAVNVPAYLAGDPECMRRTIKAPRPREIVRVRINASVASAIDAGTVARWGAAVASAIDALARSGRAIEVWAGKACSRKRYNGPCNWHASILVKPADALLDWQTLAFWITSAAAQRVAFFSLLDSPATPERVRRAVGDSWYTTGMPEPLSVGPCIEVRIPGSSWSIAAASNVDAIIADLTKGTNL